jgi:GGDEF domain-containing protein
MVAEAESRLRSLLRESDQIERVDDDRFRIVVQLRNEQDVDGIKARVAAQLSSIELPRRTAPLSPRIELAEVEAVAEGPA